MNTINSRSLKPTATLSAGSSSMRAIHVRQTNARGHTEGSPIAALGRLFGISDEMLTELDRKQYARNSGITIAYQVDPINNLINVGFSKCRDDEAYNKSLGFKISIERIYFKDQVYSFSVNTIDILDSVLASAKANGDLQALNTTLVDKICYEHLSMRVIEFAIIAAVKVRLENIQAIAADKLANVKMHQKRSAEAKKVKRVEEAKAKDRAAIILAKTLVANNQIPPIQ